MEILEKKPPGVWWLQTYDSVSVLVEIDGQKWLKMKYHNFNCKRGHLTPINMDKSSKYVLETRRSYFEVRVFNFWQSDKTIAR